MTQTQTIPKTFLGVGPGKTTRLVETRSPVDAILAERGAKNVNVNLLRYFYEPATLDSEAQAFLQRGMALAMEWATQGLVVPHVSQTIDSTVEAINAGLQSLKSGSGTRKVVVIVDRDLAIESPSPAPSQGRSAPNNLRDQGRGCLALSTSNRTPPDETA